MWWKITPRISAAYPWARCPCSSYSASWQADGRCCAPRRSRTGAWPKADRWPMPAFTRPRSRLLGSTPIMCYRRHRGWRTVSSTARPARSPTPCSRKRVESRYPRRIVCLTEEPTEVLYALGLEELIVGISGFTVRPARARREKPRVSAFTSAKIDRILELRPDLVIGFSDIQADIAHALIKSGVEVWISNHRSVEGILGYVRRLGAMVGAGERAERYALELEAHVERVRTQAAALKRRPRVYFEEWDEPMISGIRWVSELIELAGGTEIFPERARSSLASGRIIASGEEVIAAAPEIIFGSWCGKRFRPERVAARSGWDAVPAVREAQLHEIKSPIILQPGPAALTEGVERMQQLILAWAREHQAPQ